MKNLYLIADANDLFSIFYRPRNLQEYLDQLHLDPKNKRYGQNGAVAIQTCYEEPGYWYNQDEISVEEAFDDIYRISARAGTVLIGIKYKVNGCHSLLVRASQDPNVLIVYDNNNSQSNELTHIYKNKKGLK